MSDPEKPPSLSELEARLKAARAEQEAQQRPAGRGGAVGSGMGLGFRIAIDLVIGPVVGVGIGLLLDHWLGTGPLFLIVFFFLGAAAGILNVYRTATGQSFAVGYHKDDDRPAKSDDEGD